jgi:hypothetical protein
MKGKEKDIISTHELDDDKKENITRYAIEKLLKTIKVELPKNGRLKIIIEKA